MANLIIIKDSYLNYDALENVVNYVINTDATHGVYGGYGVLLDDPYYYYMDKLRTRYRNTGKQVQHFVFIAEIPQYLKINYLVSFSLI